MNTLNSLGKIVSVNGQVIEVEFQNDEPIISDILVLENDPEYKMQVYSSSSSGIFYCLAFTSTKSISRGLKVKNTNSPLKFPVGEKLLGRVVDVFGRPIDSLGKIEAAEYHPIIKEDGREKDVSTKREVLETGIKVVDLFSPVAKGGKIGLFGGTGVGKTIILTEILNNVVLRNKDKNVSIFAGVGERTREGHELYNSLKLGGSMQSSCLIFGSMGENPAVRFLASQTSATLAEYFRDVAGKDVLFFIDNVYRFAQAGKEISTLTANLPSEDGYQPTLESEMANFHERLISTEKASITTIETIYVPGDDLLDHGVQAAYPYLESVVILSRSMYKQGILPAVDIISSSSSVLEPGIVGEKHYQVALKAKALLKQSEGLERIVSLVGGSELSTEDQIIYKRAKKIKNYMTQNFFVTAGSRAQVGSFVPRETTVNDCYEIISGKYDYLSEDRFLFVGSLADVKSSK